MTGVAFHIANHEVPMTRLLIVSVMLIIALGSQPALAARASGTSAIARLQLDSEAGRQDLVWLRLNIAWVGTTCLTDWAYFDAEKSPHMLQLVLWARTNNRVLEVYVDDSVLMVDGYCRITNLSL
jgi:hypothetical protein